MAERNERQMFEGRRYDGNDRRARYRPARINNGSSNAKLAKKKAGGRKRLVFIALLFLSASILAIAVYQQWLPLESGYLAMMEPAGD